MGLYLARYPPFGVSDLEEIAFRISVSMLDLSIRLLEWLELLGLIHSRLVHSRLIHSCPSSHAVL